MFVEFGGFRGMRVSGLCCDVADDNVVEFFTVGGF